VPLGQAGEAVALPGSLAEQSQAERPERLGKHAARAALRKEVACIKKGNAGSDSGSPGGVEPQPDAQ
jgi:hypothetical protein